MAVKDHVQHYEGLTQAPTPADLQVPNTVSRAPGVGERAFLGVVAESGKPALDSEFNLREQAAWMEDYLLRRWHTPSGFLRGRTHYDAYCDWVLEQAPVGLSDDSGEDLVHADRTLINSVILPRLEAVVAGHPVTVEYVNTSTPGYNLIGLSDPRIYDGTNATVKRTDFIFLEVWRALVAPSQRATGQIQVVDNAALAVGDTIDINGTSLTVAAVPGAPDTFVKGGSEAATATNIATALNLVANSFDTIVTARAVSDTILLTAVEPGAGDGVSMTGNFITLAVTLTTPGSVVVSGATLTGGADRPNKPEDDQSKLYRHGNVQSPSGVWLDDEMVDPIIGVESSQRIQLQYRIRTTSNDEAINYKKHPDGFSNLIAGGGPNDAAIFAQGNRAQPVWSGNGTDVKSYPFVPADKTATWLDSSAVAFGFEDDGLWVAGDGSEEAAQYLGAIDGFVFAIPIGFVHRHNNVSASLAGFKGFDPESNANGAPEYDHGGYSGPLGTIPAGLSDRPDGAFCDVINTNNLLDLRRHVVPSSVDLAAELQYQMQSLLDGNLRTWSVDTASKQDLGGDSGDVSTRYLICNEIGRTGAAGGDGITAGDIERGVLIRNFDHICRRFADQPVVERVVIAFWPGDRNGTPVAPGTDNPGKYVEKVEDPAAPGTPKNADQWYEGDILHLDLEFLNATTLGGIFDSRPGAGTGGGGSGTGLPSQNFLTFAPEGTVITDVLGIWHDDGNYGAAVDQDVQVSRIKGLGTTHLEVRLDANDTAVNGGQPGATQRVVGRDQPGPAFDTEGSARRLFMEVEVTYPIGSGATDTPDHEVTPDGTVYSAASGTVTGPGPLIENSASQRPADYEALLAPRYRGGFREIQTEYVANDTIAHGAPLAGSAIGTTTPEQIVSMDRLTLRFPRRVYDASGLGGSSTYVNDVPGAAVRTVDNGNTEYGSSSRVVKLDAGTPLSGAGQTLCDIRYFAQDPIPNYGVNGGGWQLAYYFRSNSPQTAGTKEGDITTTGDGVLPTTLRVEPLLAAKGLWTGQVGMGGHELAFPYASPLDQVPINDGQPIAGPDQIGGTTEEWFFAATAEVAIDDFDAATGLLNLHAFVQQDIQDIATFGGAGNDEKPRKDAEFRAYYPFADTDSYRPTVMAQPLSGAARHKVMVPFLARASEDVPGVAGGLLFRKSELLLVVLSRFAELDDENTVVFTDTNNRTLAAVYRTRNLLLTVGDRTCPAS